MTLAAVIERVERVAATRADAAAPVERVRSALGDVHAARAYLDACEADLARRLAGAVSFPEATLAEASRDSLHAASKTMERAATLDATPPLAAALHNGVIGAGHVDVVTRAARSLEPAQREQLFGRVADLVPVAAVATVEQFGRRVRHEAHRIVADDGMSRLERQVRDTSLTTWTDADGMWCLKAKFDPVTGLKLSSKLDATAEALFAEATPDSCPSDPVAKQRHLAALSLARLIEGTVGGAHRLGGRSGRPEFVAVIDIASGNCAGNCGAGDDGGCAGDGAGNGVASSGVGPQVQWPIPIEVPARVLADLIADAEVNTVVVRNGVVLHAPGELNLGRTTRLANRAQRRALRALYRTCAIGGCTVSYDRCNIHHIIWWRHGGRTDLDNLIPVCSHHHHNIHDDGWNIHLGPHRQLTLTLPDGNVRNTGPPRRAAA